jgi:hypothetical protein
MIGKVFPQASWAVDKLQVVGFAVNTGKKCGNFPQQRINTESVATKLTDVSTATDRHRIK